MEQLQPPSTVSAGLQASSPLVGVNLTSYQIFPAPIAGDSTTGKDPPGHIPEPASHQSTGIRAECTTQQLFDGSQQQPHQPGSDMFSTTFDELHPSTATVQPGYGLLSLVTTASSNSQEEDSDFTEVGMPLKTSLTLLQTPFKGGGSYSCSVVIPSFTVLLGKIYWKFTVVIV